MEDSQSPTGDGAGNWAENGGHRKMRGKRNDDYTKLLKTKQIELPILILAK